MCGTLTSKSAQLTNTFFIENMVKNTLVSGFGYGRNTQLFVDSGIEVGGIEISKTAIKLPRKHY